jgi:hypothetical protein
VFPTVVQSRASPGVYTATLLYLPFSSWALLGARRDGVPGRAIAVASCFVATVKIAVFAPMPSASAVTAITVKLAFLRIIRKA